MRILFASLLLGALLGAACGDDDYGIDFARPQEMSATSDLSTTDAR